MTLSTGPQYGEIPWDREPDLEELKEARSLLSSDKKAATSRLKVLAERGSIMSMVYLANSMAAGAKSEADYEEMLGWYREAAKSNVPFVVYCYCKALDQAKRFTEELQVLNSDTLREYPPALNQLANLYREGVHIPKNLEKAEKLYQKAAGMGHLFARRRLASFYATGHGGLAKIPIGVLSLALCVQAFVREYRNFGVESERLI